MDRLSTAALSGVPETLLIPLAARLLASERNPDLGFIDPAARVVGERLAFDPARFADDRGSMRGSIVRALWFDSVVRRFLAAHPDALCVSIGSGLDTRTDRVTPPPGVDWYDIEFPDVVALRQALIPARPNVHAIAADGANVLAWVDVVPWHRERPMLVLAEGVCMYLKPEAGAAWLRALDYLAGVRATPLTLAFDFASPFMVRNSRRNPSVRKTQAQFSWGLRRIDDAVRIAPGFRVAERYDVARRSGVLSRTVSMAHRLITGGRPLYGCATLTHAGHAAG
ncbi:class I SAM-dependent methyltransferase [Sphingomonas alpina]|uniref:Class I SAM-dependent methyltransferase n=1 Tax=Sphingomonas alpina TaxID=653931 RepID=A0A7H0LFJ1_9SPHN|nr:class I SAM-dependent methyltransferase [Sphingomonas alpina]QNQ08444.1 class I SAM-dependent methyltransferase [Sphingomonas alpina]